MIQISIYKKSDIIMGFQLSGHAGYAEEGEDIVCAAVSSLVFTTINSIEEFTDEGFVVDEDAENAFIEFRFDDEPEHDAQLLVRSMVLGLEDVLKQSNDYMKISYKEE